MGGVPAKAEIVVDGTILTIAETGTGQGGNTGWRYENWKNSLEQNNAMGYSGSGGNNAESDIITQLDDEEHFGQGSGGIGIASSNDASTSTPGYSGVNGTPYPLGGRSYVNDELLQDFMHEVGTSETWKIKITALDIPVSSSYDIKRLEGKVDSVISLLTSDNLSTADRSIIPELTVTKSKSFNILIGAYDDAPNNISANGITIYNSDPNDGIIELSGVLNVIGNHKVIIGGYTFIMNVVEEPTSANILSLFN